MAVSGLASMMRRLDKVERERGRGRLCVIEGPVDGDFGPDIADKIASGEARPNDLFILVNRFCDDWTPE